MFSYILFDLDGTLTDPKEGITKSVQYALHKMGIDEPNCDELTPFIGPPLAYSFQEFYQMDQDAAEQAIVYYRERFAVNGWQENIVYAGIPELLAELTAKGCMLAVATSKPTVFAERILRHFGLRPYFKEVIGSHLDGTRVAKGEVIAAALAALGQPAVDAVLMIGDRRHDVQGAQENDIAVVGVEYGYSLTGELAAANADYRVDSVGELAELLRQVTGV